MNGFEWIEDASSRGFEPERMLTLPSEEALKMLKKEDACRSYNLHYKTMKSLTEKGLVEYFVQKDEHGLDRGYVRLTKAGSLLVQMIEQRNKEGHTRKWYDYPFKVFA